VLCNHVMKRASLSAANTMNVASCTAPRAMPPVCSSLCSIEPVQWVDDTRLAVLAASTGLTG
jgi:hypothetical protein